MPITSLHISVDQLKLGMFVSSLDCGWASTPYPIQGFYIRQPKQIRELKNYCSYVNIDIVKGRAPLEASAPSNSKMAQDNAAKQLHSHAKPISVNINKIKVQPAAYSPPKPVTSELKQAKRFHDDIKDSLASVSKQVVEGKALTMDKLNSSVGKMVDSVLRSPDTFTWLCQVNNKDNHTYNHALRCAVWSVTFGRHIGLSKAQLDILAAAVLLKDIGKIKLPKALLEKKNKTEKEKKNMKVLSHIASACSKHPIILIKKLLKL